jgi:hypothetical protein
MRVAIDFNDQSLLRTHEVGDKGSDDRLSAEFVAAEL